MRRLLLLFLLCTCVSALPGQDVEGFFGDIRKRIRERDFVNFAGGASLNLGYNSFVAFDPGAFPRQPQFNFGANANLNVDLMGIDLPFNVAYSNRNTLYNLPSYSFVGLSPTYKWITLHGGDRSLSFSPYSLSGVNFTGGGVELKPGKWYVAGMHRRLRRARIQDAGSIQNIETPFRRMGTGFKAGYDDGGGTTLLASWFNSTDEIDRPDLIDTLGRDRPERNMVLTLRGSKQLTKFLRVEGEWGRSVLSRDNRVPASADPDGAARLFGLFSPNGTSTAADAYQFGINLTPGFGDINLRYERIDPEYRTHGALFFQNDVENVTAGFSAPFLEGKLTLATNLGVQRNDIENQSAASNRRFIGSLGLTYAVSQRVQTNFNFSNFTTTNRLKAIAQNNLLVDSVVLAQTQQAVDFGATFLLDPAGSHTLLFSTAYQRANLIRNEEVDLGQANDFGMVMLSYAYSPAEGKSTLSATLLGHRNESRDLNLTMLGPSLGYQRRLGEDKASVGLNLGYQIAWTALPSLPDIDATSDGVLTGGVTGSYAITKKQNVSLTGNLVRAGGGTARPGYRDFQVGLAYGYSF